LAGVVLCFAVYFSRHPEQIPDFSNIRWEYLGWIILLSAIANILAGLGYHTLARLYDPSLERFQTLRIFLLGRTLNLISPQGGTFFAAVSLKVKHSFGYTKYIATMTASLWLDISLASAVALPVLAFAPRFESKQLLILTFACALSGCLLLALIALRFKNRNHPSADASLLAKAQAKIEELGTMLSKLVSDPRRCLNYAALSLANTAIHGTRLWLCFAMLGQFILWPHAYATTVIVKASNTVAITPGNFGIVEGIIGLVAGQVGIPITIAILAGVTYRFASYAALISMSAVLYFIGTKQNETATK
jgi:uncharacterized protein (TIRG00374 family)